MAYSDKVIEHYNNPRNVGSFAKDEANVGTGVVGAPECGDVMKLQLKISDAGVIEDAQIQDLRMRQRDRKFLELRHRNSVKLRKHIDEAMTIKNTVIVKELNLPPVKIHCSVLAEDAIKCRHHRLAKKIRATNGQVAPDKAKEA